MDVHEMRMLAGLAPLPDAPQQPRAFVPTGTLSELRFRLDTAINSIIGTVNSQGFQLPPDMTKGDLLEMVDKEILTRNDVDQEARLFLASMLMEVDDLVREMDMLMPDPQQEQTPEELTEGQARQVAGIIRNLVGIAQRNNYEVNPEQDAETFVAAMQLEFKLNPSYFQARDRAYLRQIFEDTPNNTNNDKETDAEKVGKAIGHGVRWLAKKGYQTVRGVVRGIFGKKGDHGSSSSSSTSTTTTSTHPHDQRKKVKELSRDELEKEVEAHRQDKERETRERERKSIITAHEKEQQAKRDAADLHFQRELAARGYSREYPASHHRHPYHGY